MEALKSLNSASKKCKEDVHNRNLRNSHIGKVKFLFYMQQQLTIKLGGLVQLNKHYQINCFFLFLFILCRRAWAGDDTPSLRPESYYALILKLVLILIFSIDNDAF